MRDLIIATTAVVLGILFAFALISALYGCQRKSEPYTPIGEVLWEPVRYETAEPLPPYWGDGSNETEFSTDWIKP
jgi:hypothetical protein